MFFALINFFNGVLLMATLADKINTIQADVAEIKTKVDALTTGTAVDLTPVTNALATVQATVDGIKAELIPTV